MEINSREVLYKFFKKRNSARHIFSNNMLFCEIEFKENGHEKLLTEAEFELNILLMEQFLFNYEDAGKHRLKVAWATSSGSPYLFRGTLLLE